MLEKCKVCGLSLTGTLCQACRRPVCSQCSVTTFIDSEAIRLCVPCNDKNEEYERGDWVKKIDPKDPGGSAAPARKPKRKVKISGTPHPQAGGS